MLFVLATQIVYYAAHNKPLELTSSSQETLPCAKWFTPAPSTLSLMVTSI